MTKLFTEFVSTKLVWLEATDNDKDDPKANGKAKGMFEAMVTSWGQRETKDGRKFDYQPEAFAEFLNKIADEEQGVPAFFQHDDENMPVGIYKEFEVTKEGLIGRGHMLMNTTRGADLYEIMKTTNMVQGVSVGVTADEYHFTDDDGEVVEYSPEAYFTPTKAGIKEVSFVMDPANPASENYTLEAIVKDGSIDLRRLERHLRDLGVSQKNSVIASSVFKKLTEQRDFVRKVVTQTSSRDSQIEQGALLAALEQRELIHALSKRI